MIPRRIKKRDANEPVIVELLRKAGYRVYPIDEPCDLLVQCHCGMWHPIEVKNPDGRGVRYTPAQQRQRAELHRPIPTATNPEAALELLRSCPCITAEYPLSRVDRPEGSRSA